MPKSYPSTRIAFVLLLIFGCSQAPAADPPKTAADAKPAPKLVSYDDAVTLSNGAVEVEAAASVGRITGFGAVGGPDLMWRAKQASVDKARDKENPGWINYGGDKVWPSFQSMWARSHTQKNWPPDTSLDGSVWELEKLSDRSVRMTSPVSPYMDVRIIRVIELDEAKPRVTIRSTIERTERNPFPVHVWSVAQSVMPDYTMAGVSQKHPQGPHGGELHALWNVGAKDKVSNRITALNGGKAIRWDYDREAGGGHKTGTLGSWCAAVLADHVWVLQTAYDPDGAYPDAASIHLYTHGEYTELETLSPQVQLKAGESVSNTVVWTLLPVDGRDAETLAKAIDALPAVE